MDQTAAVGQAAPRRLCGRYELKGLLGRGGMGEVHAGRDVRLGREVAVKLLRPDLAVQESTKLRFESEARSAAQLIHPNVVAVFDTGEEDGIPFLVMERLSGTTLADQIAGGAFDPELVGALGVQILAAVSAAHAVGLVHRDIKPGNVLVAGPGVWKVGDFGIAKSVEHADQDLTLPGLVMGTPAYLAPERLAGGPATAASDLYAVGVVLYEALTGRKPFARMAPAAALTAAPVPIDHVRPGVDPRLVGAISQALETDPRARFTSAAAMAAALPRCQLSWSSEPTVAVAATADATLPREALGLTDLTAAPADGAPRPPLDATVVAPVPPASSDSRRGLAAAVALALAATVLVIAVGWAATHPTHSSPAKAQPPATTQQPAAANPPPAAGPGTPTGSAALPAGLDDALGRLERTVQP